MASRQVEIGADWTVARGRLTAHSGPAQTGETAAVFVSPIRFIGRPLQRGSQAVSRDDWLFDEGRRAVATERIYAIATDLIFRDGFDAFSVDALAAHANCSRATVYRYVGGKKAIRDAVLTRAATRIVEKVRGSVDGRTGPDRVLTAVEVAVAEIRADPAGPLFIDTARGASGSTWLTASPAVAELAAELSGLAEDDPQASQWIVRLVLSLLFWPDSDPRSEHRLLQRFVAPSFAAGSQPPVRRA
jgi:AcrR family transcriptional regulator